MNQLLQVQRLEAMVTDLDTVFIVMPNIMTWILEGKVSPYLSGVPVNVNPLT